LNDVRRRLTILLQVALGIALTLAAIAYMDLSLFSHFSVYDDEGWMMIVLRHFLDGGVMYDRIPNVYGPFYYLAYGFLYGPLGVPLTTDAVRFVTMGHWIGSIALCCACVWLLTRQTSMVALTFLGVLFHLTALRSEPAHPQELCTLLFAALAASAATARPGRSTLPLALGAAIATSLIFTKINVGVLATLAWLMAVLFAFDFGKSWRIARWFLAAAAVALPVLLMRGNLDEPSTARFAGTMVLAVVCLLISQRHGELERMPPRWWIVVLALVLPALLSCAFVLARGTSLHGLWEGLVLRALRFTGHFHMPIPNGQLAWRVVWVAPIVFWAATSLMPLELRRRKDLQTLLVAGLKLLFGGLVFVTVLEAQRSGQSHVGNGLLIAYATPFLGLALVPPFALPLRSPLARLFLCWFALLEVLIAYPVAGTQGTTGTFLFLPIAAICLADALAWLRSQIQPGSFASVAQRALTPLVLAAVAVVLLHQVRKAERTIATKESLDLPGAQRLRLEEHQVAVYHWLAHNLTLHSDTFLSNIGLNSLYFWTGKPTPSDITLSTIVQVFSDADQHALLTALESHPRSFFVFHEPLFERFIRSERPDTSPRLIREMRDAYEDRGAVDGFHLLSLKTQPPPTLVDCCRWTAESSFSVSIAARPGQSLGRVGLHDLTTRRSVPLDGVAATDALDRGEDSLTDGATGAPIDLSVARELRITLPPGEILADHRLLLRLHDSAGRPIGLLPFLDRIAPEPANADPALP
jgi:hypothetical protein